MALARPLSRSRGRDQSDSRPELDRDGDTHRPRAGRRGRSRGGRGVGLCALRVAPRGGRAPLRGQTGRHRGRGPGPVEPRSHRREDEAPGGRGPRRDRPGVPRRQRDRPARRRRRRRRAGPQGHAESLRVCRNVGRLLESATEDRRRLCERRGHRHDVQPERSLPVLCEGRRRSLRERLRAPRLSALRSG